MKELINRIREAKFVLLEIQLYESLLNLIIFLLSFAILFQLTGVQMLLAPIPAVILLILFTIHGVRKRDIIKTIESKHPSLDERLKTAYDNIEEGNIIAEDLVSDVSTEMDEMESSSFFGTRDVALRVFAIIALTFILLTAIVLDFRYLTEMVMGNNLVGGSVDKVLQNYNTFRDLASGGLWEVANETYKLNEPETLGADPGGERPGFGEGPIPGYGGGVGAETNEDIYGEPSAVNLHGQDVAVEMHPEYGGEIEIEDTAEAVGESEFTPGFIESAEACEECKIGPDYEEIIRRYWEQLVGEV